MSSYRVPKSADVPQLTIEEECVIQKRMKLLAKTFTEPAQLYYHDYRKCEIPRRCRIVRIEQEFPLTALIEVDGEDDWIIILGAHLKWMQPLKRQIEMFEEAIKNQTPLGAEELGKQEDEVADYLLPREARNDPYGIYGYSQMYV